MNNLPAIPPTVALGTLLEQLQAGSGLPEYLGPGSTIHLYVSTTGDDETGDGTSLATAYATLRRAYADIPDGYERLVRIHVAAGSYADMSVSRSPIPKTLQPTYDNNAPLLHVIGESLDSRSVTLVSAAQAGAPLVQLVQLNIGAFSAIPANSFVVQTLGSNEYWYPIISSASPNIVVPSTASFFTPGEVLEIRSVDVTFSANTLLNNYLDYITGICFAGAVNNIVAPYSATTAGLSTAAGIVVQPSGAFGYLGVENIQVFGIKLKNTTSLTVTGKTSLDLIDMNSTALLAINGMEVVLSSLYASTGGQVSFTAGSTAIAGFLQCGGAGVALSLTRQAAVVFVVGEIAFEAAVTTGISVSQQSSFTFQSVAGTGLCATNLFDIATMSQVIGSASVGFDALNNVQVGATSFAYSTLPKDDLAAAVGTRQICRAT